MYWEWVLFFKENGVVFVFTSCSQGLGFPVVYTTHVHCESEDKYDQNIVYCVFTHVFLNMNSKPRNLNKYSLDYIMKTKRTSFFTLDF